MTHERETKCALAGNVGTNSEPASDTSPQTHHVELPGSTLIALWPT